ncbi:MAG: O-antigen ligase family protein [Thermodesulfovibrionales bacterium]|nr:O-antigen ligase family protein [Thermodesulfovibrionales bacterium]
MTTTEDDRRILWIDNAIMLCLGILIFILPVAHTATIRSLALYIPIILLILRYSLTKNLVWIKTSFEWKFLAFFAVAVASLITSVDQHQSLKEIWGELITPIILFYTVYLSIRKESNAVLLLKILFWGSLVFSIYSFYDFQKHGGSLIRDIYRAGGLRDPGGGEVAGLYHTMVIPFLFWGLSYFKNRWQRIGLSVLLMVNMAALHITFTRAAVVAFWVQAVMIIALLLSEKRWIWSFLIAVFILTATFVYAEKKMFREDHAYKIPSFREYLRMTPEEIAGPPAKAVEKRLAMWKTAIEKISENPFHAHGYSRFLFAKVVRNEKNEHFIYPQVHNTFIGIAFELGVQGLIIFLWMIGTFIWVCFKNWKKSSDNLSRYLSAALLTMMCGYWVNNFFGSFDGDDSKLLFMLLLGMGMAVMNKLPKGKTVINR